jgi:hypothetical protein
MWESWSETLRRAVRHCHRPPQQRLRGFLERLKFLKPADNLFPSNDALGYQTYILALKLA